VGTVQRLLVAVLLLVAFGMAGSALAQETGAARPAAIHAGVCGDDDLGESVADLEIPAAAEGEREGSESATVAESSFTTVPLALDALLADDHSVSVAASEDDDTSIACGEIGGARTPEGSLIIVLRQQDDSGYGGIAFFAPNAADPGQTDVSLFAGRLVGDVGTAAGSGGDDDQGTEESDAGATDGGTAEADEADDVDEEAESPAGPQTLTLGSWEITITAHESVPSLATTFETYSARGVFLVVYMTVTNTGNDPGAFPYDDLRVTTDEDRTYNYASEPTFGFQIGTYNISLYEDLQPGLAYETAVVFDVPPDASGLALTTTGQAFEAPLE